MKYLFIDYHPRRTAVALTEDGKLVEFYYERNSSQKLVGNIYKGKVESTFRGMKAAFVNIGLKKNAFLSVGEALFDKSSMTAGTIPQTDSLAVSSGDVIMCQVIKDQFGTKGARVTTDISLPGRNLVLVPGSSFVGVSRRIEDPERRAYLENLVKSHAQPNMGFIVRTLADKASDEEITDEMELLLQHWNDVLCAYKTTPVKGLVLHEDDLLKRSLRELLDDNLTTVYVNDEKVLTAVKREMLIRRLNPDIVKLCVGEDYLSNYSELSRQAYQFMGRKVELSNGGYLIFDRTEALTVVDVNTGRCVGQTDLEDTVFSTNIVAASEIARQIRLRNLGGIIVVDFIDMQDAAHRAQVLDCLEQLVKKDRIRTHVVGMTPLGLVEITRKKERSMADDVFMTECPYCHGAGRVYLDELVVMRMREAVLNYFRSEPTKTEVAILASEEISKKQLVLEYFQNDMRDLWCGKKLYLLSRTTSRADEFYVVSTQELAPEELDSACVLYME